MGFAIPVNTVVEKCRQIIEKKDAPEPYVGLTVSKKYTQSVLNYYGYPAGAVVQSVDSGSPAEKAGLQRGDIITSFDREAVTVLSGYHSQLMKSKVGDEVKIGGQRQGNGGYVDIEFTVTIGSKK